MSGADLFIADYQHVSLIEYPGKISSIIFTYGCNLRCRYCHNPSLVTGRRGGCKTHEFNEYLRGKDIEAVAVTGGEPLVSSGLTCFLAGLKDAGYKVKLDTNGFLPDRLAGVCAKGLADYVALDVKAFCDDDARYITRADVSMDDVCKSVDVLRRYGVDFEMRHTLWKTPDEADVRRFAENVGNAKLYVQKIRTQLMLDKRFVPQADTAESDRIIRRVFSDAVFR